MAVERDNTPNRVVPGFGGSPADLSGLAEGLRASGEVLARATSRSGDEARTALDAVGPFDAAFPARLGDLYRAQAFLWAGAGLAAGERLGRSAAPVSFDGFAAGQRGLVLGTVASELWSGYALLRERSRWFPWLVSGEDWELQHRRGAGRVLDGAAALGGTLIKAGQFASTRPDLLPRAYTEGLSDLQDRVPPQPWQIIEGAVSEEIGGPLDEAFAEFDREPIAAASIAQVHRARLRDGREVAVKVQYPGIGALIEADLQALEGIFAVVSRLEPSFRLGPILDYLRWTLPLELDFSREAQAIEELRATIGHREDVAVPEVVEGLNTERLLVMGLEKGVKVTDREGIAAAGLDPAEVAELLVDLYAEQVFEHGVFHADPHPGNLLVRRGPQGPVFALLDHGLTLRLDESFVGALGEMVQALRSGDLDGLTDALEGAGLKLGPEVDLDTLLGLVGVLLGGDRAENSDLGETGMKLGASVGSIPVGLLLVGRAIGLIDGIVRQLHPDLDTIEIVARRVRRP